MIITRPLSRWVISTKRHCVLLPRLLTDCGPQIICSADTRLSHHSDIIPLRSFTHLSAHPSEGTVPLQHPVLPAKNAVKLIFVCFPSLLLSLNLIRSMLFSVRHQECYCIHDNIQNLQSLQSLQRLQKQKLRCFVFNF